MNWICLVISQNDEPTEVNTESLKQLKIEAVTYHCLIITYLGPISMFMISRVISLYLWKSILFKVKTKQL